MNMELSVLLVYIKVTILELYWVTGPQFAENSGTPVLVDM